MTFKVTKETYARTGMFGVFGFDDHDYADDYDWVNCREDFEECGIHKKFLFCFLKGEAKGIRKFLKQVEDRLHLPKRYRVKLDDTTEPNIMLVRTTKFWRTHVTQALLTILLRAGRNYKNDFWGTVESDPYLMDTQDAFVWFLMGNTKFYRKNFDGWFTEFEDKDLREITEMLIHPRKKCRVKL